MKTVYILKNIIFKSMTYRLIVHI